mgnify:FL=1
MYRKGKESDNMLKLNLGDKVLYEGNVETVVGIDRIGDWIPYLITYSNGGTLKEYKHNVNLMRAEYLQGVADDTKVRWVTSSIEQNKIEEEDSELICMATKNEESEDYILDQYKKLREGIKERIAEFVREVYELEVEIKDIERSVKQEIKKKREAKARIEKQIEALKAKYFID